MNGRDPCIHGIMYGCRLCFADQALCRECGAVVEAVEMRDYPNHEGSIHQYPVTMPCGHSAGFTGKWPR